MSKLKVVRIFSVYDKQINSIKYFYGIKEFVNETMKRIIASLISGIVFPILFTLLAGFSASFIENLFPQYNLMDMEIKGEATLGVIFAPIAVPFWIYDFIRFYNYFGLQNILDTFWFRVLWTVGFNFLFYTGLAYLFFWYFSFLKQSNTITYTDPPQPPHFESIDSHQSSKFH